MYTQPSGLKHDWDLKYSVTMQSPWAGDYKHITGIIVGVVLNVQPFLHSWLGFLVSITIWYQIALLSDYPRSAVLRALHPAVPRIVSRTPWDVEATQAWALHVLYIPPATRNTIFHRLRAWLRNHVRSSVCLLASVAFGALYPDVHRLVRRRSYTIGKFASHRSFTTHYSGACPPRGGDLKICGHISTYMNSLAVTVDPRVPAWRGLQIADRCRAAANLSVSHPRVVFALHSP